MDGPLVEHVLDEELDRPAADPVVGLKLADQPEVIPSFDSREHAGGEGPNRILANTKP